MLWLSKRRQPGLIWSEWSHNLASYHVETYVTFMRLSRPTSYWYRMCSSIALQHFAECVKLPSGKATRLDMEVRSLPPNCFTTCFLHFDEAVMQGLQDGKIQVAYGGFVGRRDRFVGFFRNLHKSAAFSGIWNIWSLAFLCLANCASAILAR